MNARGLMELIILNIGLQRSSITPLLYGAWSFLLTPGWEEFVERPLVEIAAQQWQVANETILTDLALLPPSAWHWVRYADLVADPKQTLQQVAAFADLGWDEEVDQVVSQALPVSRMTFSAPAPEKWRKHESALATVLPGVAHIAKRVARVENSVSVGEPQ
jgi:hypothetical protein